MKTTETPPRLSVLMVSKKNADFPLVEGRGRFVHDDEACLLRHGARDSDHLPGSGAEAGDRLIDVDFQIEGPQDGGGAIAHRAPVDQAEAAGFARQIDVLGDGALGARLISW